ncbi:hypothetical protein C0992_007755 [Termitomyces sp. T32_za158]|nr:hypothetical protein C0992_007755 [Termitomyces sp. T32_za158]
MPPKKQPQASGSKIKDDKTFGLKNKNKSAKVQKQVALLQAQAAMTGKSRASLEKEKEKALREKAKADEEKRKKEEAAMLKPVMTQKVPFGVDPKTVLCAYFKAGQCEKGNKCKFSHDLDVGRKVEKKNLYEDSREDKLKDTMDTWDDEKLRKVVLSKAGNPRTTTDVGRSITMNISVLTFHRQIVCKYFIQAIEGMKFGWFWECPNGDACQYRHALPPGFVLRSQKKAMDEAAKSNEISLEEFLEVERHKLGSNLTPVTRETFAVWKKTRMDKKAAEEEAVRKAKNAQNVAGKSVGMSGRDLVITFFAFLETRIEHSLFQFTYNPEWFADSDEEDDGDDWDLDKYRRQKEADDLEAEERRISGLSLQDGFDAGDGNESGEGQ